MEKLLLDWLTLALAAMGFALGVVNYLTDLLRRRPRAVVLVRNDYAVGGVHVGLRVSVVNTGEVPVSVCKVFFELRRGKGRLWDLAQQGDALPKVLHPGEHCEVVLARGSYLDDTVLPYIVCVCISTPSGVHFRSKKLARDFLDVPLVLTGEEPGPRSVAVATP